MHEDSFTSDRLLDSLPNHKEPCVVGLDWERDGWRVSFNGSSARHVSRDDLLHEDFDGADFVVAESAHFKERNAYSVAQVYSERELQQLTFRSKLRLFPGMPGQLARAARDVGHVLDKQDKYGRPLPNKELDAETMAAYALKYPEKLRSWKRYRLPGSDPSRRLWEERDRLRDDLREALNPLRAAWSTMPTAQRYALPEIERFCQLLDTAYENLDDEIREQFGIKRTRNGIRVEKMTPAITAYLCVYDRDGNLRRRPDGGFIGVGFIVKAVGLCNSYRPNMARSQLTHYGMRHYKGGREGGERSRYMRNLRRFLAILRDADLLTNDRRP